MKRALVCLFSFVFACMFVFAADVKKTNAVADIPDETKVTEKKKPAREEGGEQKRPDMQSLTGMAEMLKKTLELTDEQYKKVKELAEKGQKELDVKGAELKKIIEAFDAERAKDTPDLGKVKDAIEKRAKSLGEMEFLRFKFNIDIKPLLKPEQIEKMKEMRKKMEEHMKSARDKRGKATKEEKE
ncbi:MAG: hypothetical protein HZC28_02605 [Spirochaetes bacterium]|nr:hypothetical protein [Spirochaetota bacterium]